MLSTAGSYDKVASCEYELHVLSYAYKVPYSLCRGGDLRLLKGSLFVSGGSIFAFLGTGSPWASLLRRSPSSTANDN